MSRVVEDRGGDLVAGIINVLRVFGLCVLVLVLLFVGISLYSSKYSSVYANQVVGARVLYDMREFSILEYGEYTPKVYENRGHLSRVVSIRFADEYNVRYEYGVNAWTFEVVQYCERFSLVGSDGYDVYDEGKGSKYAEDRCYDRSSGKFIDRYGEGEI